MFFCWEFRRGDETAAGREWICLRKFGISSLDLRGHQRMSDILAEKRNGALPSVPGAELRRLPHRRVVVGRLWSNAG